MCLCVCECVCLCVLRIILVQDLEISHLSANGLLLLLFFFFFIISVVDVKVRNDYGRHRRSFLYRHCHWNGFNGTMSYSFDHKLLLLMVHLQHRRFPTSFRQETNTRRPNFGILPFVSIN